MNNDDAASNALQAVPDPSRSQSIGIPLIRPTKSPLITQVDDPAVLRRAPTEVFEDHLQLRLEGKLEEDLRRNFAEDVTLLTVNSCEQGHEAIRISAKRLHEQLPNGKFEYIARQVNGPYALLVWRAVSDTAKIEHGADSFVISGGKIRLQTIHYHLVSMDESNGD